MLPPPVRERHCSSPGRPSCGPPRGGRAWLDFFFFPLGGEKGRESDNGRGGSLSIFFPSLSRKVFPNLSRTRQKKGCRRPPPSSALRGPCRPPRPLRVGRRPFLSRGRTCSASPSGRSRRVRRRRAAATGRHAGEEETLARMSPRAASEMSSRNPPSLPARLRLSPWCRPPLVERKETREGQTARNDADDALDDALYETKKPKKSHLHLSFSFFFAGERPGAPQSSTPPACHRLPQQHRPDPLLDPRRRQRPHPGIRGRPGPRPPGEQSVGRKKEKEERERKKREREREREKERKPQKSRPPQKNSKKKLLPPLPQGFHDRDYKLRRASLAEIARNHVPDTPPPFVAYSSDETAVWSEVFAAASRLYPLAACPEFLRALPALGFTESAIPQLRDVSETLERKTGWQVRPVAGLMHPRDFLAGLAFKTFHSTQYTRHASRPAYTPVSLIFLSL